MFIRTLFFVLIFSASAQAKTYNDWYEDFLPKAKKAGIEESVVKAALKDITPNQRVIALDKKQPEHKLTLEEYLDKVINQSRINKGRALLRENKKLLNKISETFGVEPEYIIALWGIETSYGNNTGSFEVIPALATMAYEGRRRDLFERELIAAFKIIKEQEMEASELEGSWAGAMGQCQFMPSSYLSYAVDYDNDGKKDIWGTEEDVFASIANYLYTEGWDESEEEKRKTLMHWNRSKYFVAAVMKLAKEIKE